MQMPIKPAHISTLAPTPAVSSHRFVTPATYELPTSAQKSAATLRRRKEERRTERLEEMRAQTVDGTLVVRQMTDAQRVAASEAARRTRERNEARFRSRRASALVEL